MRQRYRVSEELMDRDAADPNLLRRSLDFIEAVNRRLGYTRATTTRLEGLLSGWPQGRPVSILDIATGSADVPRAICEWADRHTMGVRVVGVDRQPQTLVIARRRTNDTRITLVQGDALRLPFAPGSFDFVMSSMFLHHLDADDVIQVIRSADEIARCGVLLADLSRSRRALGWITLFTLFSNSMVRHDARVSVRQAFRPVEVMELAQQAGVGYLQCHRCFGHRFVLAGTKPGGEAG